MTQLLGGLRVLGDNVGDEGPARSRTVGVELTNSFFAKLVEMTTVWAAAAERDDILQGRDR